MTTRNVALVTGASGGIGEALARELGARGHDLVLVARSRERLDALGAELAAAHGLVATPIAADLAVAGAGHALARELGHRGLPIDVLVNNAGFGDFGEFWSAEAPKIDQMILLNMATLTELFHDLLPGMVERKRGWVMNVASTAAFMPGPWMAVYYATKAYVLSLSEAVHEELKGTGVSVTALCPGPTESEFQAAAAMEESKLVKGRKIMSAATVARLGVDGMLKGRPVVVTGLKNRVQALTPKFTPRRLLVQVVKRAQAAAH